MKKIVLFLFCFFCLVSGTASAWQHEIAIGYGQGGELEEDYQNYGAVLTGKLYKFCPIDQTLIATIDGTVAHWRNNSGSHEHLTTVAIAPALRAYFMNPNCHRIRPYLDASIGPTYLSDKQFGDRVQGSHFALQTTLEVGTEIGSQKRSIDLNFHLAHYCNAGLFRPNQGINILYIFTVGYQF